MKISRPTAAAALIMLLSLTGCSVSFGSSEESSASAAADSSNAQTSSADTASVLFSGTPSDTDAAYSEIGGEEMKITFGEFLTEYKFYLVKNGISANDEAASPEAYTEARQDIIDSLIADRIVRAKFAEYDLSLTAEDKQSIQTSVEAGISAMRESLKAGAAAADSSLSEEEIKKQADEQLEQLFTSCGITNDTLYGWQEALLMKQKLTEKVGENAECSYSDAEKQMNDLIALAKSEYNTDPAGYQGQTYAGIWIPEGSRNIQAILVSFDYDTYSQITSLRAAGKDEEADSLRMESLSGLQDRYEQIMAKVVSGEEFEQLMTDFNEDEGNGTFLVTPGTELYGAEFAECAMGISAPGGTAAAVTDYGYYILHYLSAAEVTEDTLKAGTEAIFLHLLEQEKSSIFSAEYEKWKADYAYVTDPDILGLG